MAGKKVPLGIELVKRKVATEADVKEAIRYQKEHPNTKIGEALAEIGTIDEKKLVQAMSEILGEKVIIMRPELVNINISKYISIDTAKKNKVIPFDEINGKVKVCFSDVNDPKVVEQIRLMLLHSGYSMEKYISFSNKILSTLESLEVDTTEDFGASSKDITKMVDTIIKTGMEKRASDISSNTKVYAKDSTANKNIDYSKDYIKPVNGTISSNYGYRSGGCKMIAELITAAFFSSLIKGVGSIFTEQSNYQSDKQTYDLYVDAQDRYIERQKNCQL